MIRITTPGGLVRRTLVAIALLSIGTAHAACTDLDVTVLPLEPIYDHAGSFAELTRDAKGVPTFGYTRVRMYVAIQGCKVTVGYSPAVVRVARELVADQCAFDHVLKHEEEHVRIYRESLPSLPNRVRRLAGSPDLGNAILDELSATKPLHAALDSPQEYHTNRTACEGRIFSLTGAK